MGCSGKFQPQLQTTPELVDALVIGGGPAGTTAAALLAEQGWRVTLLEKDQHPRFHIGESLLPANLPILQRLGVLEAVRRIAVHKPGADFTGPDGNTQAFAFSRALGNTPDHAFQVRRSEFDALLLDNCRSRGVDVRQRCLVTGVKRAGDAWQVDYQVDQADGSPAADDLQARLVVDASGRDCLVGRLRGWRRRSQRHASAAVFGHFRNVQPRPGELAGNISVYWFKGGWIWMIPLTDEVMSVGAVCWPGTLQRRNTDLHNFLFEVLAGVPDAAARVRQAQAVSPVHATGNYSYRCTRMYDDGILLVGDAYAFIDPVFSSGVYLAMHSAMAALQPAQAWLQHDPAAFRRSARVYGRRVNRKLKGFAWFIYRFTTPTMRDMFKAPRNDWQVEQAVISMLAGDADGSSGIRRRLSLFKLIYTAYLSRRGVPSIKAWWDRLRQRRVDCQDETILN